MAYTPINWQTGDTITAEKLNRCDNGWNVGTSELFSETVTTVDEGDGPMATLEYSDPINADVLYVTFDGDDYTCPAVDFNGMTVYGGISEFGPTFTDYPFIFGTLGGGVNSIITETAGTHTIAASAAGSVEASQEFAEAVNAVAITPLQCAPGTTTSDEMYSAFDDGRLLYIATGSYMYIVTYLNGSTSDDAEAVAFVPEVSSSLMTIGFDNDGVLQIYTT